MKALIMTDIEGVAGVVSFESQAYPDGKYYEQARLLLTAEVNAAVDGLLESGVNEVIVIDGHGPGAICFEKLHPAAQLFHGRPVSPDWLDSEAYGDVDFCAIIGQHAMAGKRDGNLNHTFASRIVDEARLNGEPIGEIAAFAYRQGLHGRPVIFLSGDRAACREATELIPEIVTAEVKVGLGRNCALCVSQAESHKRIRQGVSKAVADFVNRQPKGLTIEAPYTLEIRYFHTDVADNAVRSGAQRVDSQTVKYTSDNLTEVLNKL